MAQAPNARTAPRGETRPRETDRSSPADRLADVAARVRQDARQAPLRYLRSTEVPGGGE